MAESVYMQKSNGCSCSDIQPLPHTFTAFT
uniref:Uncharacterized protein n=1 Tax=Podoviridae sp. ctZ5d16 TaxID=2825257 RepID=A0A8S5Q836_9CAUD|nr:MAG TPA: hypothetical protein [Podoviridae sp. ctZ5d16]